MRGIHTFRGDWTTQVISCNPWSTGLCPYPSLIRKMKTYLELEGKLGIEPQPWLHTSTFLPDKNSSPQKTLVPKKAERNKRAKAPVKRRFKVRVIAQPLPANPNLSVNPILPTDPTPTVVSNTATTQMPVKKTAMTATSIPVTVYNLAQGKAKGIPCPTRKLQEGEGPSAPSCNTPQEEQQTETAVTGTAPQNREGTPWPNTTPASMNFFSARASWPIPPTVKMEKAEEKIPARVAAIPCAMVNKPPQSKAEEMCRWGLHCPICTKSTPTPKWRAEMTNKTICKETIIPQTHNIPYYMTFWTGSPNT